MTKYEFMIIVDPTVTEEERNTRIEDAKKTLTDAGASITNEDVWGDKKLAYKINGQERAYYVLFTLELDWTKIAEISKELNLNRTIWRYMFSKIED